MANGGIDVPHFGRSVGIWEILDRNQQLSSSRSFCFLDRKRLNWKNIFVVLLMLGFHMLIILLFCPCLNYELWWKIYAYCGTFFILPVGDHQIFYLLSIHHESLPKSWAHSLFIIKITKFWRRVKRKQIFCPVSISPCNSWIHNRTNAHRAVVMGRALDKREKWE